MGGASRGPDLGGALKDDGAALHKMALVIQRMIFQAVETFFAELFCVFSCDWRSLPSSGSRYVFDTLSFCGSLDGVTRGTLVGCASVSLVRMQGAGRCPQTPPDSFAFPLCGSEKPELSFSLLWPVLAGAAEGRSN